MLVFMLMGHSFLLRNSLNSAWHFVKFCGSLRKVTVNSVIDSQPEANQFCCLKYPIY